MSVLLKSRNGSFMVQFRDEKSFSVDDWRQLNGTTSLENVFSFPFKAMKLTVLYRGNHSIWLTRKRSAWHISHVYEVGHRQLWKRKSYKKKGWVIGQTFWLLGYQSRNHNPYHYQWIQLATAQCVSGWPPRGDLWCVWHLTILLPKAGVKWPFCAALHFIRMCCPALIKPSLLQSPCFCGTTQLVSWWLFMSLLMLAGWDMSNVYCLFMITCMTAGSQFK